LVRSMTHQMPVHGPAASEVYTGRPYFAAPTTDQATPQDWPSLASLVARYGPRGTGWPPSVVLPWYAQFAGQDRPLAGPGGGAGARARRASRGGGAPPRTRAPPGGAGGRRAGRGGTGGGAAPPLLRGDAARTAAADRATAFAMLNDDRAARALEIHREPRAV